MPIISGACTSPTSGNPAAPVELGLVDTPGDAYHVELDNSPPTYAYVADLESGLRIIDVSDLANPNEVGSCDTPGTTEDLTLDGSTVYVADGNSLRIIDVNDPAAPFELGFYYVSGSGVAVSKGIAYIANGSTGLNVLNVSDPSNPTELGYYVLPVGAQRVTVDENLIYAADVLGGLFILRFTPPPPTLEINHETAAPGSFLNLSGVSLVPNEPITITVNGLDLGAVAPATSGLFTATLSTNVANEGLYFATAGVTDVSSDRVRFTLDDDYPLRPQEGDWPIFELPAGIALDRMLLFPIMLAGTP